MTLPSPIFILAMITMLSAIAVGVWQLHRVKKAKERGENSAFSEDHS